jgi:biotin carboxyl carrier protein
MSGVTGKVGELTLRWDRVPEGNTGTGICIVDGKPIEVRWKGDAYGLWVETAGRVVGYDFVRKIDDQGDVRYQVTERRGDREWNGVAFLREGEEVSSAASGGKKKSVRVRAQMPGKILKLLVQPGAQVEKNQPLLVMEAMKMENEIRSAIAGEVANLCVKEGQAVETGALLLELKPDEA